jgi:hypothetical protein
MFLLAYAMKPFALLTFLFVLLAPVVAGAADPVKLAQIPVLSPTNGPHPDLDTLLQRFWKSYYNADGALGFDMSQIRVGRMDLNDDDDAELILMITHPGWRAEGGFPFVIATWLNKEWSAVGWGWGEDDTLFSLVEVNRGWHSVETSSSILRWNGQEYERTPKSIAPVGQPN